jgi:lactoylglutathione lyase
VSVFTYDHVHLRSPDPEATAQFYEKMFGADVKRDVYPAGTPNHGRPRITMNLGGQTIMIAPSDPQAPTAEPPKTPYFGLEHIGLRVDDIDAAAAELKRKGAEFAVEPVNRQPGTKLAFIRAPQNVLVELIQRDYPTGAKG